MVDNILVRLSSFVFVVVVISVALFISLAFVSPVVTKLQAQAQPNQTNQMSQNQNQTRIILGLLKATNVTGVEDAMDIIDRQVNSAKLHNATSQQIDKLNTKSHLLSCIADLVRPPNPYDAFHGFNLKQCEDNVTDMIVKHELGNNQTMIKVAYAFLKSRGIQ
jgi:hypothetical protein